MTHLLSFFINVFLPKFDRFSFCYYPSFKMRMYPKIIVFQIVHTFFELCKRY